MYKIKCIYRDKLVLKKMKNKKYLVIISLAILFFSINCISASDNATDLLSIDDNGDDVLSYGYNSIETHDMVKTVGNATQYEATLYDNDHRPLKNTRVPLEINKKTYYRTTDSMGFIRMNINLMPGAYDLEITNPVTFESEISEITVLPNLINNYDLTKYCRGANQYYITALNGQGNAVPNQQITFNIHGVFYTRTSDENGRVKLNINLEPGEYILTAMHGIYKTSNKINVLERIDTISPTFFRYYEEERVFKVQVLDDNGQASPQNENIKININGVIYTRSLANNGEAKLNINLMPGTYIATVDYKGYKKSFAIDVEQNPYDANRPAYDDLRYKKVTFNPADPAYYKGPNHIDEVVNGWNPSAHEISRSFNPDGTINVRYDDGYFRLADSNGYVITWGFA